MTTAPTPVDDLDLETIRLERDGAVLVCTLDRPDVLNALSLRSLTDLASLWAALAADPSVGAVVVTGAGRAFCAGGDVSGMATDEFDIEALSLSDVGTTVWKAQAAVPQPIVAAVNGDAAGAGLFLAALCDLVLAAPTARFGDPHVRLGLVASGSGILVASIGLHHTRELLLTGRMVPAARAQVMGLVASVHEPDDLLGAARERAGSLAALPAQALRWTKQSLNRHLDASWSRTWDAELALEALSARSPEHRDAVARFRDRS